MPTDAEIARNASPRHIADIAARLGFSADDIECYGKYKAKLPLVPGDKKGKLVLVTAMNPTPLGEGKTTVSISLADGLVRAGKNAVLALREPSLGPVFGIKGGACGGGYAQVIPMEDINLHFTGDFHAVTAANNLLAALVDNHIHFARTPEIAEVVWARCLDINDRALREVEIGLGGKANGPERKDGFVITAASEIMAVLCMADGFADLKRRLGDIVVGYTADGGKVTARDIRADEAMAILLRDASRPNLVQTLEGTPALVHGGPFANIAHGCNSIAATRLALSRADIVVTEAGFGAELGGEKFFDIKCRKAGLTPSCTVLVVTARSLKFNGGVPKEETAKENVAALEKGFENVKRHLDNLKSFSQRVVVAINRFASDTDAELEKLSALCREAGAEAVVSEGFARGGEGALALAGVVADMCDLPAPHFPLLRLGLRGGQDTRRRDQDLRRGRSGLRGGGEAQPRAHLGGSRLPIPPRLHRQDAILLLLRPVCTRRAFGVHLHRARRGGESGRGVHRCARRQHDAHARTRAHPQRRTHDRGRRDGGHRRADVKGGVLTSSRRSAKIL